MLVVILVPFVMWLHLYPPFHPLFLPPFMFAPFPLSFSLRSCSPLPPSLSPPFHVRPFPPLFLPPFMLAPSPLSFSPPFMLAPSPLSFSPLLHSPHNPVYTRSCPQDSCQVFSHPLHCPAAAVNSTGDVEEDGERP